MASRPQVEGQTRRATTSETRTTSFVAVHTPLANPIRTPHEQRDDFLVPLAAFSRPTHPRRCFRESSSGATVIVVHGVAGPCSALRGNDTSFREPSRRL